MGSTSNGPYIPAVRLRPGHRALDQGDDDEQDRSADTRAGDVADDGANVKVASRLRVYSEPGGITSIALPSHQENTHRALPLPKSVISVPAVISVWRAFKTLPLLDVRAIALLANPQHGEVKTYQSTYSSNWTEEIVLPVDSSHPTVRPPPGR